MTSRWSTTDIADPFTDHSASTTESASSDNGSVIRFYKILVTIGAVGAASNLFVIIVIIGYTNMCAKITGTFVLSQCCLDFSNSLLLSVDFLVFIYHGFVVPPSFGKTGGMLFCRLYLTEWLQWGLLYSSTYNLIGINLERYLSVVHPVAHRSLTRTTFGYPTLAAAWLIGPAISITWAQVSTYMDGWDCLLYDFHGNEDVSSAYAFFLVTFIYFIPLTTMSYFYGCMIWVLQKSVTKQANNIPMGGATAPAAAAGASKMSRAQKNLFRTMLIVTVAYVCCWTLDQVCWLLYQTGIMKVYDQSLYYTAYVLVSFNACVNPLIYIFSYREFKRGMNKMLRRGRVQHEAGSDGHSAAAVTTNGVV